ncbi:MAG: hypothetical protein IPM29_29830 [Planctomycetes bacterium]|nr:hypothetical protein [Planctomycetota bacterium]
MSIHRVELLAALGICMSFAPATAQLIAVPFHPERRCAGLLFWDDGQSPGSFVIQYGVPTWKAEYDALITSTEPSTLRLGRDAWTSLDNNVALRFGDEVLPVGYWYLALRKDGNGRFALAAFDAARLRHQRAAAHRAADAVPDHTIPMALARRDELTEQLVIATTAAEDAPTRGTLAIRWGTFELTAGFDALLPTDRAEAFAAALADMIALLDRGEHRALIETYADPEFVRREKERGQLDQLIADFADSDKPRALHAALVTVQRAAIEVAPEQDEVVHRDEDLPQGRIRFSYLDGRWYLMND